MEGRSIGGPSDRSEVCMWDGKNAMSLRGQSVDLFFKLAETVLRAVVVRHARTRRSGSSP